jgi:hypothetical protein
MSTMFFHFFKKLFTNKLLIIISFQDFPVNPQKPLRKLLY